MANKKLTNNEVLEIRKTMAGLKGRASSYLAKELAKEYGVHKTRIYEITEDLRAKRNTRSDKGKRKANWDDNPFLDLALRLIITKSMKPEDAYKKAKDEGYRVPVSLETFKRYLKEDSLWIPKEIPKTKKRKKKVPTGIVLDDDIAEVFTDSESVNQALRGLLPIIQKQAEKVQHS